MASKSKTSVKFPSIQDVASALRSQKHWCEKGDEGGIDVRLQVWESGSWTVHTGDSSYDQDHNGYWGSGYLTRSTNCRQLAYEMLEEAKDHAAQAGPCNAE
jgi:hypothetical protein